MTERQPTCGVGSKTDHPCTNPATERLLDDYRVCEGHKLAFELGEEGDDLRGSLEYLKRWIRAADRYYVGRFQRALRAIRDGFADEPAELEARQIEIKERYSLPPDALEQLRAKERGGAVRREPESEGERRWQESDRRASRFTAAVGTIEMEIDRLQARLEEEVLPLLEEEAEKAGEEAGRVKAEFGL